MTKPGTQQRRRRFARASDRRSWMPLQVARLGGPLAADEHDRRRAVRRWIEAWLPPLRDIKQ